MADDIGLKINYRSEVEFNEKRESAKLGKANSRGTGSSLPLRVYWPECTLTDKGC